MGSRTVKILGADPKEINYMDYVIDPLTGQYLVPLMPKIPKLEELKTTTKSKVEVVTVFIDTGVVHDHPFIKNSLLESIDFTGEGPEDYCGHGTVTSLIYLVTTFSNTKIINLKALNKNGEGSERNMIKAIQWVIENKHKISGRVMINISAGIRNKRWFFLDCKGNCKLCEISNKAVNEGILFFAASGNTKGVTYCPAKAERVMAVESADFYGQPLENSGIGNRKQLGVVTFGVYGKKHSEQEIRNIYIDDAEERKRKKKK